MKKASLIALAAVGALFGSSVSASPEPQRYDIQVRLLEKGKLLASPRLIANAGQVATFASDDGANRWSVKVTANPAPVPVGVAVTLATDVEFWSGLEDRRRATTTILVTEGEPALLELKPRDPFPAVRVEISARSL